MSISALLSRPRSLKFNLVANFVGTGWTAMLSLAFVPLYIHFLGIESYGLIGFFAVLQAVFAVMDMGLAGTVNRELARLSLQLDRGQEMRNLVRTLEVVYVGGAVLIGIVVVLVSPVIAQYWLGTNELSVESTHHAIVMMGFAIAVRWPFTFYSGGLMGLQRQVMFNVIKVVVETLRSGGAVLVLWLVSPTLQTFFLWQVVANAIGSAVVRSFLWSSLPGSEVKASFKLELFKRIFRFAVGVSGASVTAALLMQVDKIILSKMVTLEMFGYYTLASVLAMSLLQIISPIFSAMYPRLTQLVALTDWDGLKQYYHFGCQILSAVLLSFSVVVSLFSKEILLLWTQNPIMAEKAYMFLSLLILSMGLIGLMNLPYALQLANGWTKLAFEMNLGALLILTPLIIILASHFGPSGAAVAWVVISVSYVIIGIQRMHRRLLPGEKWRWYIEDVGMPLIAALVTVGVGRLLINETMSQAWLLASLILIFPVTLFVTVMATPRIRHWVLSRVLRVYGF